METSEVKQFHKTASSQYKHSLILYYLSLTNKKPTIMPAF